MSRQKELHADPKAIQQIEFVGQLKNPDNEIVANGFIFVLTILEKNQRNEIKIFSRKCNSIIKTTNYEGVRVKLPNTQLNKLKSAAKNKTWAISKINKKNFQDEEFPHELFLRTRQTTKIRNAFANKMSTDIKLSMAQISKII